MIQCEQVVCLDIQGVMLNTHVDNYLDHKGLQWAAANATVGDAFIRKGNRCVQTTEIKDTAMNMIVQESDTNFFPFVRNLA